MILTKLSATSAGYSSLTNVAQRESVRNDTGATVRRWQREYQRVKADWCWCRETHPPLHRSVLALACDLSIFAPRAAVLTCRMMDSLARTERSRLTTRAGLTSPTTNWLRTSDLGGPSCRHCTWQLEHLPAAFVPSTWVFK